MSDGEETEEKILVTLEEAKSDRSTCRATGEKIAKGEWRVGIEAWRGGRQSMTWQKAGPFLRNCAFEEVKNARGGACKKTGHKFAKGEVRFIYATGNTRMFLTIPAAREIIGPVLDIVDDFEASDFKGVDELPEEATKEFEKEFGTSDAKGKKTRKRAEVKDKPEEKKPAAKKRKSNAGGTTKAEKEDQEDGLIGEAVKEDGLGQSSEDEPEGAKQDLEVVDREDSEEESEIVPSQKSPENAYEKQRQARIAANKQRLLQMGILDDAEKIMPKNQPKPRTKPKGVAAKKLKVPAGPRRTSARVQGLAADGQMIEHEGAGGKITYLNNPDQYRNGSAKDGRSVWDVGREPEGPVVPKERHSKEPISFVPEDESKDVYSTFLDVLKKCKISTASSKTSKGKPQLQKLKMKEEDLAKVTGNGISHVQWLPSSNHMIVAAADKSGNVGIWNVDHKNPAEGDDGVYQFTPHYQYISGMRWASTDQATPRLYTSSYDGSLRCLDVTAGIFSLSISSEDSEYSSMDCTADGNVVFLGDNDGDLQIYDIRDGSGNQRGKNIEIHNKRINTLHVEPGSERELLSASSDNSISVWDIRKLSDGGKQKPLATAVHSKTCQSAYFAPDGSKRVASLSRDDTVKVWQFQASNLTVQTSIPHYNNTGRWVIPFRATWGPSSDTLVVGSMKRQVDLYDTSGKMVGQLDSEFMTAIASRAHAHPYHNALAACTSSGRVHIYR